MLHPWGPSHAHKCQTRVLKRHFQAGFEPSQTVVEILTKLLHFRRLSFCSQILDQGGSLYLVLEQINYKLESYKELHAPLMGSEHCSPILEQGGSVKLLFGFGANQPYIKILQGASCSTNGVQALLANIRLGLKCKTYIWFWSKSTIH